MARSLQLYPILHAQPASWGPISIDGTAMRAGGAAEVQRSRQ